jgi:hypothetical protein
VRRSGAIALLSYQPVAWTVRAAPGVAIEKVIVSGYHDQAAPAVPAGVPVEVHTGDAYGGSTDAWPHDPAGRRRLMAARPRREIRS